MNDEKIVFTTEDVNQNKIYGILSYFSLLFLLPLFLAKDSAYAKFHANQGLLLFISIAVLRFLKKIAVFPLKMAFLHFLPGTLIGVLLNAAIGIGSIVFVAIGIYNACSGEAKTLPFIGQFTLIK